MAEIASVTKTIPITTKTLKLAKVFFKNIVKHATLENIYKILKGDVMFGIGHAVIPFGCVR